MPQMNKGGKFIFGISILREDSSIQLPSKAIEEYDITSEGKVFLISGSKKTGGFIVTRKGLLHDSKIGNILKDSPDLCEYKLTEGELVKYKGRKYCWCNIMGNGIIHFTAKMINELEIKVGTKLLSIRSSDIAFTMGAKGPLIEKAKEYTGNIQIY